MNTSLAVTAFLAFAIPMAGFSSFIFFTVALLMYYTGCPMIAQYPSVVVAALAAPGTIGLLSGITGWSIGHANGDDWEYTTAADAVVAFVLGYTIPGASPTYSALFSLAINVGTYAHLYLM